MYRLPSVKYPFAFPDDFLTSPEGLLAIGGNLHPQTILNGYSKGIFPWFNDGDPILWWHPDPRLVFFLDKIYITKKMRRLLKKVSCDFLPTKHLSKTHIYTVTLNKNFPLVINECAIKRSKQRTGTWITNEIIHTYTQLHDAGFAHSVEVWDQENKIIGGMYGIALGKIFFGESMFSHEDNASKIALFCLASFLKEKEFRLIDCQVESNHLKSLGATTISRKQFLEELKKGNSHFITPTQDFNKGTC